MANPATRNVLRYKGGGIPQSFPNLPSMINGAQDGADVGTGGANLAAIESGSNAGNFAANRNIEFLNDRFALCAMDSLLGSGVYKRNQGGSEQWGAVQTGTTDQFPNQPGLVSGLHVLHPDSAPTMAYILEANNGTMLVFKTTDGTTGANWGIGASGLNIGSANPLSVSVGQSLVFRDAIAWARQHATGPGGAITIYDFVTGTNTVFDVTALFNANHVASSYALHVHDNVLFLFGYDIVPAPYAAKLTKLSAGSFVSIYTDATQEIPDTNGFGHTAIFTDHASGDLVLVMSGDTSTFSGTRVVSLADATGAATPTDRTSTVLGAVQGADKYVAGGASARQNRRWTVFVDLGTDPDNPKTFLTTWFDNNASETWEWKGLLAEVELVAGGEGLNGDFALPYSTVSGLERTPRTAAVEIGDASNPPVEVPGGTRVYFRGVGSSGVLTFEFRGVDDEGTPSTIVPIVGASLVVESGSPPTTPAISGNTITNFTPDSNVSLYSVVLAVDAAGVNIGEGDVGLLITLPILP